MLAPRVLSDSGASCGFSVPSSFGSSISLVRMGPVTVSLRSASHWYRVLLELLVIAVSGHGDVFFSMDLFRPVEIPTFGPRDCLFALLDRLLPWFQTESGVTTESGPGEPMGRLPEVCFVHLVKTLLPRPASAAFLVTRMRPSS